MIVDRMNLRWNKAGLRHVFDRLVEVPVTLIEMNNRQFQKNTLNFRQDKMTTFKNLFLEALSTNFQKYISGRVNADIIELLHLNFFGMTNNRFIIKANRSTRRWQNGAKDRRGGYI